MKGHAYANRPIVKKMKYEPVSLFLSISDVISIRYFIITWLTIVCAVLPEFSKKYNVEVNIVKEYFCHEYFSIAKYMDNKKARR